MPWVAAAVVGGSILGAVVTQNAAEDAAEAQTQAATTTANQAQSEFDKITEMLRPYTEAGTEAVGAQKALLGLGTPEEQQAAIQQISESPELAAMYQQGENAILQNAAATGGLRGGNTQAALAQFRPALLNQAIQNRISNLGGLAQLGQASGAQQAAQSSQFVNTLGNLNTQVGQAQAGSALATGQAWSNVGSSIGQAAGMFAYGGF